MESRLLNTQSALARESQFPAADHGIRGLGDAELDMVAGGQGPLSAIEVRVVTAIA